MTIIAYKDGMMAADSCSFSGGRKYPVPEPKIVRSALGLFGAAGRDSDCWLGRSWFRSGAAQGQEQPNFSKDEHDPVEFLWVKPDWSVWWADDRLQFTPYAFPACIGESSVVSFTEGAMMAGLSAPDAVALAIRHCVWVGGEVQVERL